MKNHSKTNAFAQRHHACIATKLAALLMACDTRKVGLVKCKEELGFGADVSVVDFLALLPQGQNGSRIMLLQQDFRSLLCIEEQIRSCLEEIIEACERRRRLIQTCYRSLGSGRLPIKLCGLLGGRKQ